MIRAENVGAVYIYIYIEAFNKIIFRDNSFNEKAIYFK